MYFHGRANARAARRRSRLVPMQISDRQSRSCRCRETRDRRRYRCGGANDIVRPAGTSGLRSLSSARSIRRRLDPNRAIKFRRTGRPVLRSSKRVFSRSPPRNIDRAVGKDSIWVRSQTEGARFRKVSDPSPKLWWRPAEVRGTGWQTQLENSAASVHRRHRAR